jgi:cell division protein FtsB
VAGAETDGQGRTTGKGARRPAARQRGGKHSARRGGAGPSSAPRLHLGRIAVLVLLLIGASFYVSPLRAFFSQQDRYQHESEALAAAKAQNDAYKVQVELLAKKDYVAQVARADSMLVPPGTQVFVIKGLPGKDQEPATEQPATVSAGSISVFDRLDDLWRTLLH